MPKIDRKLHRRAGDAFGNAIAGLEWGSKGHRRLYLYLTRSSLYRIPNYPIYGLMTAF